MAVELIKNRKRYYQCKICGLVYRNKEYADKCEAWCSKNKSCNLNIAQHSLKPSSNQFHRSKYKPSFSI